jgi:diguanylate cyclase (GGDEF)-like protein
VAESASVYLSDSVQLNDAGELDDAATLEQHAILARQCGMFEQAADLFAKASRQQEDPQKELDLQIRQACCLLAIDRHEEAAALAEVVAKRARAEGFLRELADALSLIVDHHMHAHQLAPAAHVLSEAMYVLEQLQNESCNYQVVHNMAATYAMCGFAPAALELYERALALADNEADRQYTYSSIAGAYHSAAQPVQDADERERLLRAGLHAANAALQPDGATELLALSGARAQRSMILAEIGQYREALVDARAARQLAVEHGIREEQVIAMSGEAMALWGCNRNPDVLDLIDETLRLAREIGFTEFLGPILRLEIEVLWAVGRYPEALLAMQRQLNNTNNHLDDERTARWQHVCLGVEHLRVEALSESDPLTGLPNRRHLSRVLPRVLDDNAPVCVGVIDLDGFKQINDQYGYMQGDGVLRDVAMLLERVSRRGDSVARLGGDEFVMLLGNTSLGDARIVFERFRQMIAERAWTGVPSDLRLTASVGVATAASSKDSERVLNDAVTAMQVAKRSGRDRISFH